MELVRRTFLSRPHLSRPHVQRRYDIEEAVAMQCASERDGELERTRELANNVADKLGELVELLHKKGALSNDDVVALLPSFEISAEQC